jgi:hypothetical protein
MKYIRVLCSCVVILLAFAVRVHLLGAQSFWHDEGNSYVQATRSFSDIASSAARDIHPPGYYWLLAVWRALTGDTEFALRAFSTLASTLTVAFAFALGKRLYGTMAGMAAALCVALNTFSIYYAQEARMYALLGLWAAAGIWALVRFFVNRTGAEDAETIRLTAQAQRKATLLLALVNAAGLWTHYAYPLVMLAQGVMALVWFISAFFRGRGSAHQTLVWRVLGYYVAANLLTIALYVPWLSTAVDRLLTWPNTGAPIPIEQALAIIFGWLSFGITYQASSATFGIVIFIILFGLLLAPKPALPRPDHTPTQPNTVMPASRGLGGAVWRMLLPIIWVIIPIVIFMARGLFREANLKLLLPAQIGLALWLARGVWVLWEGQITRVNARAQHIAPLQTRLRIMKLAAGLALVWLVGNLFNGLHPLYHDAAFQRDDYRAIVAAITANARTGDAIILNAPNQQEVFDYYYHGAAPIYPLPEGLGGDDAATSAAVTAILEQYERVFAVFWGEAERDPQRIVETTLSAQTFKTSDTWYGDVRLVRYVMPAAEYPIVVEAGLRFGEHITLQGYALNADTFAAGDVLQVQLQWSTDAPLDTRYQVTVQLLNPDGTLAAQHDGEPGGGLALTTTWNLGDIILDNHGLTIPNHLAAAHYTLIIGLYDLNNSSARLPVGDSDSVVLYSINIR